MTKENSGGVKMSQDKAALFKTLHQYYAEGRHYGDPHSCHTFDQHLGQIREFLRSIGLLHKDDAVHADWLINEFNTGSKHDLVPFFYTFGKDNIEEGAKSIFDAADQYDPVFLICIFTKYVGSLNGVMKNSLQNKDMFSANFTWFSMNFCNVIMKIQKQTGNEHHEREGSPGGVGIL